ncbi:hypothetical protein IHV09_22150 [Fictibacillus sp. 23RED33]|uniref:hypothetical protein n=1 Tax=Fictibacillus sp. 23RED33 TaxID=2745879 RepID=UPI0018CD5243|nr:hypothetical protein [Fictibacillus sp. 23RED33]MBH0176263.1 hypothetical protein [Fictibacillus sp. 23RED33]
MPYDALMKLTNTVVESSTSDVIEIPRGSRDISARIDISEGNGNVRVTVEESADGVLFRKGLNVYELKGNTMTGKYRGEKIDSMLFSKETRAYEYVIAPNGTTSHIRYRYEVEGPETKFDIEINH